MTINYNIGVVVNEIKKPFNWKRRLVGLIMLFLFSFLVFLEFTDFVVVKHGKQIYHNVPELLVNLFGYGWLVFACLGKILMVLNKKYILIPMISLFLWLIFILSIALSVEVVSSLELLPGYSFGYFMAFMGLFCVDLYECFLS